MSLLACCIWWFVAGALVGWLLSWLLNRALGRAYLPTAALPPPRQSTAVPRVTPPPAAPIPEPTPPPATTPQPHSVAAPSPPSSGIVGGVDLKAAAAAGFAAHGPGDLTVIEGIGPRIAELCQRNGVDSFSRLASTPVPALAAMLEAAGPRFRLVNPASWPAQAMYCVRNDWAGLKRWQDQFYAAVVPAVPATPPVAVPGGIDIAAARAAGFVITGPDDLAVVEGIGPKIAELLRENGIDSLARLAESEPRQLKAALAVGGPNYALADPATWAEQARLCVSNDWTGLKALQDRLAGGVRRHSGPSE